MHPVPALFEMQVDKYPLQLLKLAVTAPVVPVAVAVSHDLVTQAGVDNAKFQMQVG
jgi:hypothetical protein